VRRAPEVPAGSRRKLKYFDLEILTVGLTLSVLVLPQHIQAQAVVSLRHILPALLFMFGWASFDDAPRRIKWPTIAALVITGAISIGIVADGFQRFDREVSGYVEMFDQVKGSGRLLRVATQINSRVVNAGALWHMHHLYGVTKGGITNTGFAERPHNPIQYMPGMVPPVMGTDFASNPAWRYYDYVMVRKGEDIDLSAARDNLEEIAENRGWTLYRAIDWPAPRRPDLEPVANPRRKFLNDQSVIRGVNSR